MCAIVLSLGYYHILALVSYYKNVLVDLHRSAEFGLNWFCKESSGWWKKYDERRLVQWFEFPSVFECCWLSDERLSCVAQWQRSRSTLSTLCDPIWHVSSPVAVRLLVSNYQGLKKPFCVPTDELLLAKDDLLSEGGQSLNSIFADYSGDWFIVIPFVRDDDVAKCIVKLH